MMANVQVAGVPNAMEPEERRCEGEQRAKCETRKKHGLQTLTCLTRECQLLGIGCQRYEREDDDSYQQHRQADDAPAEVPDAAPLERQLSAGKVALGVAQEPQSPVQDRRGEQVVENLIAGRSEEHTS